MSTKIYNGYKIKLDDMSFKGVLSWLNGTVTPVIEESIKKAVVSRIAIGPMEYRKKYFELSDLVRKDKKGQFHSILDFGFEICVLDGGLEGELLCIIFSSIRDAQKIFATLPGVTYFGYWDNVDAEEGVSEDDWEFRKNVWDKALGKTSVPSQNGLTHVIYPEYTIPFPDEYDELYKKYAEEK